MHDKDKHENLLIANYHKIRPSIFGLQELKANDKIILLYLVEIMDLIDPKIQVTDADLSEAISLNIQAVKRSIKRLKKEGFIEVLFIKNVRNLKIGVSKMILRSIKNDTPEYQKRYSEVSKMILRGIKNDTLPSDFSNPTPIYIKENNIKESLPIQVSENLFGELQKIPKTLEAFEPELIEAETIENPRQKNISFPSEIIEALKGFAEMRKKVKKPLTDRAKKMVIKKLYAGVTLNGIFYEVTNTADRVAAVDITTEKGWSGVEYGIKTVCENQKKIKSDSQYLDKPFAKLAPGWDGRKVS